MKKANTTKKAQAPAEETIIDVIETAMEETAAETAEAAVAEVEEEIDDAVETAAVDKKAARAEKRAERKAQREEKREARKAEKASRLTLKERRALRKAEFDALPLPQQEAVKNARLGRKVMIGTAVFGLAAIGGLTAITAVAAARKGNVNVDVDIDPNSIDAGGTASLRGSQFCGF